MKKFIGFSAFMTASTLSVAFVFIIIPTAHAQVASCPAGFTCTPIPNQPVGCPAGFVCTPIATTNPVIPPAPPVASTTTSPSSCYTWQTYLGIGSRGPDVVALQVWLISNGYNIPLISSGAVAKGYFGPSTAAAVRKLQISIVQPVTGYVGALTIAYLNQNSCGLTTTSPTQPVSSTQIVASLDAASPLSSTIQISTSTVTSNVPLAVFDLQSQGNSSTLHTFSPALFVSNNYNNTIGISTLFTNLFIKVGGQMYPRTSVVGQNVSFGNLNIPLPANVNVPIMVYGSIAQDTGGVLDGSYAGVQLPLSGISAVDSSGNNIPVNQGSIVGTLSGSTMMFTSTPIPTVTSVYPTSANPGQTITIYGSNFSSPNSLVVFELNEKGGGPIENVSPNSLSPTQITVIVPNDLSAGSYSITVANLSGGKGGGQLIQSNSWLQFTINGIGIGSGIQVSNTSTTLGLQSCTASTSANIISSCVQPFNMNFTLTTGNYPILVSNTSSLVQSVASANVGVDYTSFTANSGSQSYDGSNYYMIPAGSSRAFTLSGVMTSNGIASVGTDKITSIYYGTSTNNLMSNSITSGLQNLQVTASFNSGSTQQPTVNVYYPTANLVFTVGSPIQLGFSSSNALATFDVQLVGKAYGHDYGNVNAPESGARLNFTIPSDALPSNYTSLSGYQFQIYYNGSLVASSPSFTITGGVVTPTQTTPTCPAGYVCTPPGQTNTCPAGYTCTPAAVTGCPSGFTCYTEQPNTTTTVTTSAVKTSAVSTDPVLSSFTPSSAPAGTTVTAKGQNLLLSPSENMGCGGLDFEIVNSNGTAGGFSVDTTYVDDNTFTFVVPNYTYGTYTTSLSCDFSGDSNTLPFTITAPASSANSSNLTSAIWDAIRQYFKGQ